MAVNMSRAAGERRKCLRKSAPVFMRPKMKLSGLILGLKGRPSTLSAIRPLNPNRPFETYKSKRLKENLIHTKHSHTHTHALALFIIYTQTAV